MSFIGCKELPEITDEELIFSGIIKIDTRNMTAYLYDNDVYVPDVHVPTNFPLYVNQVREFFDNLLKLHEEYGIVILNEETGDWNLKYITLIKSGYLSYRVEDRYKKEINHYDLRKN